MLHNNFEQRDVEASKIEQTLGCIQASIDCGDTSFAIVLAQKQHFATQPEIALHLEKTLYNADADKKELRRMGLRAFFENLDIELITVEDGARLDAINERTKNL